jgi:hypothetical protein
MLSYYLKAIEGLQNHVMSVVRPSVLWLNFATFRSGFYSQSVHHFADPHPTNHENGKKGDPIYQEVMFGTGYGDATRDER